MNERLRNADRTVPPDDEDLVRRLLEMAGPRPPLPREDLDAITEAARHAWRSQLRPAPAPAARRRPWILALPLAAALAVAVGLAVWLASRRPAPPPAPAAGIEAVAGRVELTTAGNAARAVVGKQAVPRGATLRSDVPGGPPGRASLRLAGGAAVRLDVGSRLRFVSASVLALERGAVYVDSGSGARRAALEIRTPLGTAKDIGTRFAVRVLETAEPALLVRVRDGAVLTEHRGGRDLTRAGHELLLHGDGTAEHRPIPPHGPEWEWVLEASPGFAIEGRSLSEFLAWVSRETGWRIAFAEPDLAALSDEIRLHGSLGGLRPDRAPFAVLPGAGLEGELRDGTLVIRRRG